MDLRALSDRLSEPFSQSDDPNVLLAGSLLRLGLPS